MSLINLDAGKLIDSVASGLNSLFTSDDEREQAAFVLEKLRQQPHLLQAEINKIDANSKSWFQAGWRPFCGWTCGIGFCYNFLLSPLIQQLFDLPMPKIEAAILNDMLLALLGLGGFRTYEKTKKKD